MLSITRTRKRLIKNFPKRIDKLNIRRKIFFKRIYAFTQRNPFTALFIALAIFLLLMIIGNLFFGPRQEPVVNSTAAKSVQIFSVGSAPQATYQGKIEKSGVVKMVAQAPGIVSSINVWEGESVNKGTNILSLSTNYAGGNALTIGRQIAGDQLATARNTYDAQKDIIAKQREVANNNQQNADITRQITAQSATDTQALADLDRTIVDGINSNIQNLEATNTGGVNDTAILQSKEALAQFQGALAQANAQYQNLQVQSNSASNASAVDQYQIALKQLDLQEKNLAMTLNIARLQYNMALVNEATMFPVSPYAGVVDKIFVHVGDSVNPGTPIAQISGDDQHGEVVVYVPASIAKNVSRFQPSTLYFDNQKISMIPTFVSLDATNGVLYSIIYDLGNVSIANLTDASYIQVSVPIGVADTTNFYPFIPLDAVIQTQNEAYIFVADSKNIARVKKVKLGQIQGKYVEVVSGIPTNARIIMDRNVIEGDRVLPR